MPETNVTIFPGATILDIPAERVVEALQGKKFDRILVIGFEEGEEDIYCASDSSKIGDMLLLMERAKDFLLHDAHTK